MMNLRVSSVVLSIAAGVFFSAAVSAQDYPARPIRMVTSAAGGGTDFVARIVAVGLGDALGQQIIVDNRPSIFHGYYLPNANPDGYNLLLAGESIWVVPLLQKMPYEPMRDLNPVALVTTSPNVLVVHPTVPVKSVPELVSLAKARPGELNYGTTTPGASAHLAGAMFMAMTGVKFQEIPHSGSGPLLNTLLGGQGVHLGFISIASVMPHLKSGRLRGLGVTSPKQSSLFPGLPAVAEFVPGYELAGATALMVPPRTPAPIVARLNSEIVRFMTTASVKEKMFNAGNDIAAGSAEDLRNHMKSEIVRLSKVIKDANIKVETK
jgi:tripartite-type tricarboxylate transporter receptor subunit TctC